MNLQEVAEPISAIGLAVLDELARIGEQHSCILAARVLIEVLHRGGYPAAYSITVRAQIFNPPFYAWVKQHGFPVDKKSQESCQAAGGALIGLGTGPVESMPAGRWAGHLVVVIPNAFGDCHAMSDITIPQACKADWGVNLPPMLVRVTDAFVKGEKEFKAEVLGSLVTYMAFPDDRSYQSYPVWTEQDRLKATAERVMASLHSKGKASPPASAGFDRSMSGNQSLLVPTVQPWGGRRDLSPRERAEKRRRQRKKDKRRGK